MKSSTQGINGVKKRLTPVRIKIILVTGCRLGTMRSYSCTSFYFFLNLNTLTPTCEIIVLSNRRVLERGPVDVTIPVDNMKFLRSIFAALCIVAMACEDDSKSPESTEYPDLRIYLDRFEKEARAKGYDFDLSNVQAVYVDAISVNNGTYCGWGYSNYNSTGLRRIEISKAEYCGWSSLTDLQRENLVFHEIGHASN